MNIIRKRALCYSYRLVLIHHEFHGLSLWLNPGIHNLWIFLQLPLLAVVLDSEEDEIELTRPY